MRITDLWNKYYKVKVIKLNIKDKETEITILPEHKRDLKEFSLVSIVKFVLTEGEKFIIFAFSDFVI